MKRFLSLLFVLSMMLYADEISTAKELFDVNEKYHDAISTFEKHQDSPEANYYLGKAYYYGLGVDKDYKKAFEYAEKSASAKYPTGINLLGLLYQNGYGIDKDEIKAFALYSEAANLGNAMAMNNLARMYYQDTVIKKDLNKALFWFNEAINKGIDEGYVGLADIHRLEKNHEEALKYYLKFEEIKSANTPVYIYEQIGLLYLSLKKYSQAYGYILKASQLGLFKTTHNFYRMIKDGHIPKSKTEEAIYWLEKASDLAYNQDSESLKLSQHFLYVYYLDDTQQPIKAKAIAEKSYQNGNIELGCQLSAYYESHLNPEYNLEQAYQISTTILNHKNTKDDTSMCSLTLSSLYRSGNYVSKNSLKSIDILIEAFGKVPSYKKDLYASRIASQYLEDLYEFENAQKWYQITYELTKDTTNLTKVDEYKKTLPQFTEENFSNNEQNIFPIINNFSTKDRVTTVLESKNYYFLATDQKAINIYDKKNLSLIKELRGWIGNGINGITTRMAFDENKELLYCSGIDSGKDPSKNAKIKVFDINTGKIIKNLNDINFFGPDGLTISDDGKYLISFSKTSSIRIINTETNQLQIYKIDGLHIKGADIEKVDADYVGRVLGEDGYLYGFSVNKKRQISKELDKDQIPFKTFNSDHAKNIFSTIPDEITSVTLKENILLIKSLNNEKQKSKIFDLVNLNLISHNRSFENDKDIKSNITIRVANQNRTLDIYKNDKKLSTIELLNIDVVAYKIIEDKYILVSTSDITVMYIFDLSGRPLVSLQGFLSLQKNIYYQDKYLITYGEDNIIHLWNIDNLDQLSKTTETYDQALIEGMYKLIGGNILEMFAVNEFDDEFLVQQMKNNKWGFKPTTEQIKVNMRMTLLKKEEIYPLASLYTKDDDWIVFDNKGLFASSPNGTDLIRYHQNKGFDKEARIVNNSQVFEKFYRPDLIKKKLSKEKVDIDLKVTDVISRLNPPEVIIIKEKKIDPNNLEVTYKVCDRGSGVSDAVLLVNGISIIPKLTRGFKIESLPTTADNCTFYKNIVTLKSGVNSIEFKAFDASKTISAKSNTITGTGQAKKNSPSDLYFVSIAISDYEDRLLKLNFPVNDVLAVKEKIEKKGKALFKNIHTFNLHNNDATKDKLDNLFTNLSKKIKTDDVLVVYFAGHGVTSDKDGLYYFYPYNLNDVSHTGLKKDAISVNDIKSQLSKTQAYNSLILFDTCNSGGVIDSVIENQMIHRLSQDNKRNFIAASSSDKPAYEGYKGHGVFTYAVLDAFDQAYSPTQMKLTTTNLAEYVKIKVPKITFENWHYEQTPQTYLHGDEFEIGIK